ncbi:MAG: cysteine hydrolase [Deltaproteobacteria bacterium]|nr:cysteine hydrolase [Deltaproteobacteria bacterium]
MKANETAIVFIEFQNDFCKEGGALYEGVKDQIKAQNTIKNAQDCLQKARGKCLTLLVPILFEEDYCDAGCEGVLGPIHGNVLQSKAFRKNTWGGEIIDELKPTKQDIVVEGKRTLDAFNSTNLDFILRTNCIKNVAFCGFLTNVCVEGTARSAYDKAYKVFLLKDCCAAISGEEQKYVEEKFFPYVGEALSHDAFLKKL